MGPKIAKLGCIPYNLKNWSIPPLNLKKWSMPPLEFKEFVYAPPRFVKNNLYPPSIFTIGIYPPRFQKCGLYPPLNFPHSPPKHVYDTFPKLTNKSIVILLISLLIYLSNYEYFLCIFSIFEHISLYILFILSIFEYFQHV